MPRSQKIGAWVTGAISIAFLGIIAATFINNASPYVDIAQAKTTSGDDLHLVGTINKKTLNSDVHARMITFVLNDLKGKSIPVQYVGEAIANINDAKSVVAVGHIVGGQFEAHQLLIKCPSKYQDSGPTQARPNSADPTPNYSAN